MPAVLFYLLDRHASLAMTKGTKWIIPHSLTTPAASRHPSNGGELGAFPPRNSYPLRRMGLLLPSRRGLGSPLRRGGTIPGPAKMQFSWVVVAGWFVIRSLGEGWYITNNRPSVVCHRCFQLELLRRASDPFAHYNDWSYFDYTVCARL